MGKGGGQQQPTEQTVVQSNLPKYVEPYFKRLLERTESESKREYSPYEGQRLADESSDLLLSRDKVRDIASSGIAGLPEAQLGTQLGMARGVDSMDYKAKMFTPDQAQKYMSPYIQNVLDRQKAGARKDWQKTASARAQKAIQAGAFGNSGRGAIQDAEAEEQLATQLGDIDAEGMQKAYMDAQGMFEKDRAAEIAGEKLGLSAAEMTSRLGTTLADLGAKARAGDIQSAKLLEQIGKAEQSRDQAELDMGYEDFVRQRDFPREALQFYSSILRGVPINPSTETQKFQTYDPIKDLLGTGIAGLGLYKGLTG